MYTELVGFGTEANRLSSCRIVAGRDHHVRALTIFRDMERQERKPSRTFKAEANAIAERLNAQQVLRFPIASGLIIALTSIFLLSGVFFSRLFTFDIFLLDLGLCNNNDTCFQSGSFAAEASRTHKNSELFMGILSLPLVLEYSQ